MSIVASCSPPSASAATRWAAVLCLLLSPTWAAGAAHARQDLPWPAAVRLVYEIAPGADAEETLRIVRERLDELRPRRTDAALDASGRIVVQLRSAGDRDLAVGVVGQPGAFQIALVASDNPAEIQAALADGGAAPEGLVLGATGDRFEPYLLLFADAADADDALLTGAHVRQAAPGFNPGNGAPIVNFQFDDAGARALNKLTTTYAGDRIAIVLDGAIIAAPVISSPITSGSGFIDGGFTTEGAQALAAILNAGALPAPLTLIEESTEE
jgi:preprotein translocase subunit SecD